MAPLFDVTAYGAAGDGATLDTGAIAAAFADCAAHGGGTVLFPGGGRRYLTGPWSIACNNSVVEIAAGATVASVNTTRDWPLGPDCPEPAQGLTSRQAAPFVLADRLHNVTLLGGGALDAAGPMWWAEHCGNWWCPPWVPGATPQNPYAWRPFMLRLKGCADVAVRNLTFLQPGFWCIVPTHSERVRISDVTVLADKDSPNTDGIEPMWSRNVHVADARISNGDDCITVKSGCANVLVERVSCEHSHGITVGSVWYDDVTNVTYRDIALTDAGAGPRIKGRRQGNATISNITFSNITLSNVKTALQIDMLYETPGSTAQNVGVGVRGVVWEGVRGSAQAVASLQCVEGRPCSALEAIDVDIATPAKGRAWACSHATLAEADDVKPAPGTGCTPPPPTPPPPAPPAGCNATIHNLTEATASADLASTTVASLALCCGACSQLPHCSAFTFMPVPDGGDHKNKNCWMHPANGTKLQAANDRVAGVMLRELNG